MMSTANVKPDGNSGIVGEAEGVSVGVGLGDGADGKGDNSGEMAVPLYPMRAYRSTTASEVMS